VEEGPSTHQVGNFQGTMRFRFLRQADPSGGETREKERNQRKVRKRLEHSKGLLRDLFSYLYLVAEKAEARRKREGATGVVENTGVDKFLINYVDFLTRRSGKVKQEGFTEERG